MSLVRWMIERLLAYEEAKKGREDAAYQAEVRRRYPEYSEVWDATWGRDKDAFTRFRELL